MMRLDKYLSERLGIPRGESRKLAAKGRVTVNGVLTKKVDTQIEEATAEVAVDGRLLAGAYQKYVYLMLNKPEGVVSAAQDKRDTTVVDLVKDAFPRRQLFPAGRLDKTSTGFGYPGASVHAAALIMQAKRPEIQLKASGGIRTIEDAEQYLRLGATRIGASKLLAACLAAQE